MLLALCATSVTANPIDVPPQVREQVRAATVEVLPPRCAGAVALAQDLVVTARHCATHVGERLRVQHGAEEIAAVVEAIDEVADQSVLRLDHPLGVEPLAIASRLPIEGTVLYFAGNLRQAKWQSVRVDRIGTCPSLPGLSSALFTSLKGAPGDSGAPLVDGIGRITGLVHGGAQCQIATPSDHLRRLVVPLVGEKTRAPDPPSAG